MDHHLVLCQITYQPLASRLFCHPSSSRRATSVGGVSAGNWGGTVKRTNTENFQPPENKLVSEQPSARTPNSYPHHSIPPLHAKQYSKLTKTSNNAEYHVPINSPSSKHSCLSNRCPSKSIFKKNLNLRCPKCPSPSNVQNGHSPNICLSFQATHSHHQSATN